jgi:hypothetical protein
MDNPTPASAQGRRRRDSHIWDRQAEDHYIEPAWVTEKLLAFEKFSGPIFDPCCGAGTIVTAARKMGRSAYGADIVDRGLDGALIEDFLASTARHENVVTNPPFRNVAAITRHALKLADRKVAVLLPVARLNAAHWLTGTPLRKVWLLSPRPSMPPGDVLKAGGKASGGKTDFCWLVFTQGWLGPAEIGWLYRDGGRP